jgi:hypothetical protein
MPPESESDTKRQRGRPFFASRGRGTGFAGPQAQRPPRGAANHTKWGAWGPHPPMQQFSDDP